MKHDIVKNILLILYRTYIYVLKNINFSKWTLNVTKILLKSQTQYLI